jgi:hypothetical protein
MLIVLELEKAEKFLGCNLVYVGKSEDRLKPGQDAVLGQDRKLTH